MIPDHWLAQAELSEQGQLLQLIYRPGHDRRYAIDVTKIRSELGRMAQYDFDSGIARTIDWYLENGEWCRKVLEGKYSLERLGLKEEVEQ